MCRLAPLRIALLALLALFPPHFAAGAPLPAGVTESSYVLPDGERVMELSIEVPAGAPEVWDAWTTAEGFQSWASPFAVVDFRAGGSIESSYDPRAKAGDRNNIRNEIVAFVPRRLFIIRNVQAPEKVPFDAPTFMKTQTAVTLAPVGEKATRVTVTNSGYREGANWDGVYDFFRAGNAWTLSQLRQRFEKGPTDWEKALAPKPASRP